MKVFTSFLRASLVISFAMTLSACDNREPLVIGWTANEPASEISQLLAENLSDDFVVESRQFGNAAEVTAAVQSGQIDLAILEEPTKPIPDVNVLRALFPSVLHVLAKPSILTGTATKSISELVRGRDVFAGAPGGAGHELIKILVDQQIFPAADQFTLHDSPFGADLDIFIVFGGILQRNDLRQLSEYQLISLGSVSEFGRGSWAEGVALRSPSIQPFIIPDGLYPGISQEATLSLSVQSLLVTHPNLDDQIAYQVLMRVDELMAQIRSIYPLAGRQTSHPDGISFNLTTHTGALRYEQREAPGFLERYAELLAFLVTLILALSSLLLALFKMRKQARKDRIDVYFDQLLGLRDLLFDEQVPKDLPARVIQLQHTVTQLVSEERIAADSAFVGFLELSNQVLAESRSNVLE